MQLIYGDFYGFMDNCLEICEVTFLNKRSHGYLHSQVVAK